jgi:hypothetical protein
VVDASHVVVRDVAKLRQIAADERGAVRDTLLKYYTAACRTASASIRNSPSPGSRNGYA